MEIWMDIKDYPGYQVSNLGRIRTHNKVTYSKRHGVNRFWKNRVLKIKVSKKDNCSRVSLWKDGKERTVLVHRVEAIAFLGDPLCDNMTVNHKDGNRQNNSIDNLEWLSRADNIRHGFTTGLYHSQKPCILIDKNGNKILFRSQSLASSYLNRNHGYINCCLSRGYKTVSDKNGCVYTIEA